MFNIGIVCDPTSTRHGLGMRPSATRFALMSAFLIGESEYCLHEKRFLFSGAGGTSQRYVTGGGGPLRRPAAIMAALNNDI